jgi:hypothetical protein
MRVVALADTRAASDGELVRSWLDSLGSPHTRRNFDRPARRLLEVLPMGLRVATVEDVCGASDRNPNTAEMEEPPATRWRSQFPSKPPAPICFRSFSLPLPLGQWP